MEGEPTLNSKAQRAGWEWAKAHPDDATLSNIAKAGGVTNGTAMKWLTRWREELGEDLFRGEVAQARAERTAAARQEAEAAYQELVATLGSNLAVGADQVLHRLLEILPSVATIRVDRGPDGSRAPVVVHGPAGREVKALADALSKMVEAAQLVGGRPTRHTRRSVPGDQWVAPTGVGAINRSEREAKVLDIRQRLLERGSG